MKPHFFILGNPRSGTTLFRLMMNSHPGVVVPPECGFAEWYYEKYGNWAQDDSEDETRVAAFVSDLSAAKKIETWELDFGQLTKRILTLIPSSYSQLCEQVYLEYGSKLKTDLQIWGDKNNYFIKKLEKIDAIFMEAKYIHLIRDGRDVACSYLDVNRLKTDSAYKPVLPDSVREIALEWVENTRLIEKFLGLKKESRHITIRYEDLLTETETTLKKCSAFLGIEFNPSMLDYYKLESGQEPKDLLDWKVKTAKAPDENNIGRYLSVFKTFEIEEFNQIAGLCLNKYGYQL